MDEAIIEAKKGLEKGEVPIGALISGPDGKILAKAHNQPIFLQDPSAHAEVLALREAGKAYNNYRLNGATLVVTIEPCVMCMGAALNARIDRLVFGCADPKAGAAGSIYDLSADDRLNHKIEVISGIRDKECRRLIQDFFKERRIEK
jgi:tRNA(adenine34) deaminase